LNTLIEILGCQSDIPSLFNEKDNLVVLRVDVLIIELWCSHITGSKFIIFEVIPKEQGSLVLVLEECVHPLVMIIRPLLFIVEVVKALCDPGDHDFHSCKNGG
jgi:hypothetical protein